MRLLRCGTTVRNDLREYTRQFVFAYSDRIQSIRCFSVGIGDERYGIVPLDGCTLEEFRAEVRRCLVQALGPQYESVPWAPPRGPKTQRAVFHNAWTYRPCRPELKSSPMPQNEC